MPPITRTRIESRQTINITVFMVSKSRQKERQVKQFFANHPTFGKIKYLLLENHALKNKTSPRHLLISCFNGRGKDQYLYSLSI